MRASPFWMWSSEWHSPAAWNLIRTSLAFGSSSSRSVISHGRPGARQTAARVVMLMRTPFAVVRAADGSPAAWFTMTPGDDARHTPFHFAEDKAGAGRDG